MRSLLFTLSILFLVPAVMAGGIGVSPASLALSSYAGGVNESAILISATAPEPTTIRITPEGEAGSWMTVEPAVTASLGKPARAHVRIAPPAGTVPGSYSAQLLIALIQELPPGENIRLGVMPELRLPLQVTVLGGNVSSCRATAPNVYDVEERTAATTSFVVENTGNEPLIPRVSWTVWTEGFSRAISSQDMMPIRLDPGSRQAVALPLPSLPQGKYWLDVSIPACNASSLTSFGILPEGTIQDSATSAVLPPEERAEPGHPFPITVTVENTGTRPILAHLIGKVFSQGRLIRVIESDNVTILPEEETPITVYYTPETAGTYAVITSVVYNNRKGKEHQVTITADTTDERAATVAPAHIMQPFAYSLIIIATLLAIILLLILIRTKNIKRKKRQHHPR